MERHGKTRLWSICKTLHGNYYSFWVHFLDIILDVRSITYYNARQVRHLCKSNPSVCIYLKESGVVIEARSCNHSDPILMLYPTQIPSLTKEPLEGNVLRVEFPG